MSALTTTLAWLIPCVVLLFAFIAWRVYAYKTHQSVLPSYLRRNIFERTRSFTPKTIPGDQVSPASPSTAIRNETVIIIPAPTASHGTTEAGPLSEKDGSDCTTTAPAPSIPTEKKGPSPAITRLMNMK
ncbi:hypothetical protein BG004_005387 [Podila humilis]|nr:hypothetical protein BG004_005387 [Podila humilis]